MADQNGRPGGGGGLGGNQRMMLGAAVVAAVLFLAVLGWSFLDNPLGRAPGSAGGGDSSDLTTLPSKQAQRSGESTVGKTDPGGQPGVAGERERAIKSSAQPLSLSDDQRSQVAAVIANSELARTDAARFELMIGALVPEQIAVSDLPPEVPEIMNGYWGAQCLVVADRLVIVDRNTRRIVALVPFAT
ncbi:DUF1236 domain-containing protein [Rhodopseudomonas sp. WA056]|uniref:DUF1236 domain-containing protein n=1 Tax=Rhodopseudomonas sp. WA056 TaxID=2269367 RepID=UPI0013DEDF5C|nr:DUF1236 domain-containing protein [Rhodopseudomonas sp. WA056]NEW87472.1 DUF1236 domain-containing protein [Rhodopseudomonas sp. WA056]